MIVRLKKACLLNCAMLFVVYAYSQNSPISESANSMVNTLTGGFSYSMPVMTVPGPNGENVPITFNYSGGVRVDQESSWIGLGWNYNPGEISRNKNGVSDDWKNKSVTTTTRKPAVQNSEVNSYYGPLYFKDVNYTSGTDNMDVASSSLEFTSNKSFNSPNYDEFYVSGPGISGSMEFRLFDYASFHLKSKVNSYTFNDSYLNDGEKSFTKTPNLVFNGDVHSNISSPGSMVYVADDFATGFTHPQSTTTDYSGAYNSSANRAQSSNFVEYFTNSNINTNYSTLKGNGFMDYRLVPTGLRRPTSDFDGEGIGAIRITTPSGVVYHYSLPVYTSNEKLISFMLDANYDLNTSEEYTEIEQNEKSAVSWKLTAITGIDYIDSNDNGIVDIGDSGYWVAYNYGKWTDGYTWRYPFYNYKQGQYNKELPTNYRPAKQQRQIYKNQGNVSSGINQIYYLNSIQTSTHTAFFVKSVRLDGHSIDDGGGYIPQLRLDKVVLMNNDDISLFSNTGAFTYDNRFTLTNCFVSNIIHSGNFDYNAAIIKSKSLATVEMSYDYSLCKMLYNNVNNTFSPTNATYHYTPTNYYYILYEKVDESATATSTDNSNSGKLTLNEVKILGVASKSIAPSYVFDYDKNSTSKNPNYSVFKFDWWGYYKNDFNFYFRGHHTTENSKIDADAWSLKKITTPLGGEIIVEYESNNYRKVYNGLQYASPQRIFIVESGSSNSGSNTWSITVSKEASYFISNDSVIVREVVMPYFAYGQTTGCTQSIPLSEYGRNPSLINGYSNLSLSLVNSSGLKSFTYSAANMYGAPYSDTYPGCNLNITKNYSPLTYNLLDVPLGYGYLALTYSSIQGGGTRVKSISFKDTESNLSYINEYTYESGVCGSEPNDLLVFDDFATTTNDKASDPFAPGSGITYGKVTVKSKSLNNLYNGKTVYEYNNSVDQVTGYYSDEGGFNYSSSPDYAYIKTNYKLVLINGLFGSIKQFSVFDNNNNILRQDDYEYTSDASVPGVYESFHTVVELPTSGDEVNYNPIVIMSNFLKIDKTARLKRKTTYLDGVRTIYEPVSYDAFTGSVTKSKSLDPTKGVTIITETPAYTQSAYSSMGPKSVDVNNKNILNASYKTIVELDKIVKNINNEIVPGGSPEVINGTKTTWQQNAPKRVFDNSTNRYLTQNLSSSHWMPYKSYAYNGELNDANWREVGEVTIFDKRLNVLESKTGISNRFNSSKYGYNQKFILTQANDCRYVDFTFSSFEDQENTSNGIYFGGEINQGQTKYQGDATVSPHTGKYLSKVDGGNFGPTYLTKGMTTDRTYRVSVWVHKNSPSNAQLVANIDGSVNGVPYSQNKIIQKSDASNVTVGDWILMTLTIDVPKTYTESGGPSSFNDLRFYLNNPGGTVAYFDDFMVRPIDVDIVGNIIDEYTGRMIATIDKYGFGVRYVYDDAGRIREIWSESSQDGWKLKTRYSYNFKRTF